MDEKTPKMQEMPKVSKLDILKNMGVDTSAPIKLRENWQQNGVEATVNGMPYHIHPAETKERWNAYLDALEESPESFNIEAYAPPPPPSLAELKASKQRQIESDRDAACVIAVRAHGRTWQADKRSQDLLNASINLATASGGAILPAAWRDADNNNMTISSVADLLAIATAISAQTQEAYSQSWARKYALETATTADEVFIV